jgi:hypothetical protein
MRGGEGSGRWRDSAWKRGVMEELREWEESIENVVGMNEGVVE